jgi:hypothetical protein
MSKIVYLIDQPLDDRNYERFGIGAWMKRNWGVEVWDLTPLAHPRVWTDFLESNRALKTFSDYFPIVSWRELHDRYSTLGKVDFFIDFTGDYWCSLRVKAALARRGAIRVTSAPGLNPLPKDHQHRDVVSRLRRLVSGGAGGATTRISNSIVCRLAAPFTRPGLVIVSGERSVPQKVGAERTLLVHSFDYDIYLKERELSSQDARVPPYAVFVDQDYCFHPDFLYRDGSFLATPERYFPALCNGLRTISEALGLQVKIAAHPRAGYKHKERDYFQRIPVEYGRTAELIKGSSLVVCHDSTAIHFAVLFNKPIIFVTTGELIPAFEGKAIDQVASELSKTAINLDTDLRKIDWQAQMSVDAEKYAEFKSKYIKIAGTPERPMWDIVIEHIETAVKSKATPKSGRCEPVSHDG